MNRTVCTAGISAWASHSILMTISSLFQAPPFHPLYRLDRLGAGAPSRPFFADLSSPLNCRCWRQFMTMDMTTMGSGVMLAMGIYHLVIFIFAVLGIAASVKYLRS